MSELEILLKVIYLIENNKLDELIKLKKEYIKLISYEHKLISKNLNDIYLNLC